MNMCKKGIQKDAPKAPSRRDLKQLLKERDLLAIKIQTSGFGGYIPNLRGEYTGHSNRLGISTIYNTNFCSDQVEIAMLMSDHLLIRELLESNIRGEEFDPDPLRRAQILEGMRILDMGCGNLPTFARCARRFGAEVYTVDLISADEFYSVNYYFTKDDVETERMCHIQLDLGKPGVVEVIRERSGGEFDLVTEAHLETDGCYKGRDIAFPLLKQGGIYFIAGGWNARIEEKE